MYDQIYLVGQDEPLTLEQLRFAISGVVALCVEEQSFALLRLMIETLPHEIELQNEVILKRDILASFAKVESLDVDPYALKGAGKIITFPALDHLVKLRLRLARNQKIRDNELTAEQLLERERQHMARFRVLISPQQVPPGQGELDVSPKAADVDRGATALEGV